MHIVILDGCTTNPGDLSWESLEALGELTVYDFTKPEEIIPRAQGAEIVLSNKTVLGRAELEALPSLRYIGLLSTGYNVIDLPAARERNIPVTNIPAYSTRSVAQLVFSLLLEFCAHVQLHSDSVHAGEWVNSRDFCYWKTPITELAGKTMGIIGYGRIGRQVGEIARAFGMEVAAHDAMQPDTLPLAEVLRAADVLTLHCPLTDATQGFINRETIAQMKPGAILINTSRGPVLNEQDVADALADGRLGGLGADVLSTEPPRADNPLLRAPNCLLTPHIAWAAKEARTRLIGIAAENIQAFLAGSPVNVVN